MSHDANIGFIQHNMRTMLNVIIWRYSECVKILYLTFPLNSFVWMMINDFSKYLSILFLKHKNDAYFQNIFTL